MSGISVNTLFPNGARTESDGRIDIDTLFRGLPSRVNKKEHFTSDDLLDSIASRRKRKLNTMIEYYNKCCAQIKRADESGSTDIIFAVPESVPDCATYSPSECIEYISSSLREKFIDTLSISHKSVFITWANIELNIEKDRKRKEEKKRRSRGDDSSDYS